MADALVLQVEGLSELMATFKRYFDDVDTSDIIIQAFSSMGYEVKAQAQELLQEKIYDTPERGYIRTGLLKANIEPDAPKKGGGEISVVVRAKQDYAAYIELGTSKMKPRAFMLPALQMKAEKCQEILKAALTTFLESKVHL